ncbi:MAG: ABC transporter substrate-binding protein [Rhodospirillaceae bacterium]|jgi:branched-chain amino acid transport system substrate-binding protein|nr:ABC transporter substrate-binding protein [Rhodospirillaceae bacterium]MBT5456907.1 ABC transporter substrate-binding protein [Rhodospirillaceae bacterium]
MRTIFEHKIKALLSLFAAGVMAMFAATPAIAAPPKGAPAALKVAFVDFFSGGAAVFGVSGKGTSEWLVAKWNREGGIRGVPIKLVVVDEGGGPKKQVSELRRLVLDEKVDAVVGYTSSGNCLAIAPVAEKLKILTVVHVCGTHRLTEDNKLKYVFRTAANQAADSVSLARHALKLNPNIKTIAGANEDYAWGRDSWEAFRVAMKQLKPDVKVVATLWTKFQAGEYSAEISRLLAARPDVVHSSFWGGGLITFVKQAAPRGLFEQSLVLLSTGEQVLQNVGKTMPNGVVAAPRATGGYFVNATSAMDKEFVAGVYKHNKRYPDYPAYRTYMAWGGLKGAFEKAIDKKGSWPSTEEVIKAFEGLTWESPAGMVTMRSDHQAVHGGMVGVTKYSKKYGFAVLDEIKELKAEEINPPLGMKTMDWVRSLKK